MGLEWTHPEVLGESKSLLVVGVGCFACQRLLLRVDLPVEPQRVGLVSSSLESPGERQGTCGKVNRLIYATGQHIGLTQIGNPTRMARGYPLGGVLRHRLLQQR